jgi:hypothetical protein
MADTPLVKPDVPAIAGGDDTAEGDDKAVAQTVLQQSKLSRHLFCVAQC